jgi:mono/diheme cytochrome c family protein
MVERYPNIDDQVALVANGVPGTSMRAFSGILSPEEIEAVVLYTREGLPTP